MEVNHFKTIVADTVIVVWPLLPRFNLHHIPPLPRFHLHRIPSLPYSFFSVIGVLLLTTITTTTTTTTTTLPLQLQPLRLVIIIIQLVLLFLLLSHLSASSISQKYVGRISELPPDDTDDALPPDDNSDKDLPPDVTSFYRSYLFSLFLFLF